MGTSSFINIEVHKLAELIDAARSFREEKGEFAWYRGHARSDWMLVPHVHRKYEFHAESNLLNAFQLAAPMRYARCPELHNFGHWLCLMQHFGLPTRLLDWTTSLVIASFFAVSYEQHLGDGAIWALSPRVLNSTTSFGKHQLLLMHSPAIRHMLEGAFQSRRTNETFAVVGQEVDLRMTIQQGAFTIHGDDTPLEARAGSANFLAKFVIPENAKKTLLEELGILGVRRSALFPDLANLAQELAADPEYAPLKKA